MSKPKKTLSTHVYYAARGENFDKYIKKESIKPKTPNAEKPYASTLNKMGRNAYYKEYFEEIKLENQILPAVGPFDDPSETFCFKQGYKRGEELLNAGVIPEEYKNIEKSNLHR